MGKKFTLKVKKWKWWLFCVAAVLFLVYTFNPAYLITDNVLVFFVFPITKEVQRFFEWLIDKI